jgi:hypothetical protein
MAWIAARCRAFNWRCARLLPVMTCVGLDFPLPFEYMVGIPSKVTFPMQPAFQRWRITSAVWSQLRGGLSRRNCAKSYFRLLIGLPSAITTSLRETPLALAFLRMQPNAATICFKPSASGSGCSAQRNAVCSLSVA